MAISLSTVIIARNEEKNIEACIHSAKQVSDDIILIDSGSKDNTIALAKALGARTYEYGWHGYGANKNFGNEQAKNDWILSIDGDEVLSDALIQSLLHLHPDNNTVYQVNSIVNYRGKWIKHSGWHPKWKHRVFHRKEVKWNDALVHEDLEPLVDKTIARIKGDILHYSYTSIEEHKEKALEYAQLKARQWINKGSKPSMVKFIFGPSFNFLKTYVFQRGILDGEEGWTIAKMNAYMTRQQLRTYSELKTGNSK